MWFLSRLKSGSAGDLNPGGLALVSVFSFAFVSSLKRDGDP